MPTRKRCKTRIMCMTNNEEFAINNDNSSRSYHKCSFLFVCISHSKIRTTTVARILVFVVM